MSLIYERPYTFLTCSPGLRSSLILQSLSVGNRSCSDAAASSHGAWRRLVLGWPLKYRSAALYEFPLDLARQEGAHYTDEKQG